MKRGNGGLIKITRHPTERHQRWQRRGTPETRWTPSMIQTIASVIAITEICWPKNTSKQRGKGSKKGKRFVPISLPPFCILSPLRRRSDAAAGADPTLTITLTQSLSHFSMKERHRATPWRLIRATIGRWKHIWWHSSTNRQRHNLRHQRRLGSSRQDIPNNNNKKEWNNAP